MSLAIFLTTIHNGKVIIPLLEGERLEYPLEKTERVMQTFVVNQPSDGDELIETNMDRETGQETFTVKREVIVPAMAGGWMIQSDTPPPIPLDVVLVKIISTPEMLQKIHDRLQAEDARLGRYGEVYD